MTRGMCSEMARKPANIVYGAADPVPAHALLLVGLQHTLAMASVLVLPVIVVQAMSGSDELASRFVRLSMIATGIGTILQSLARGPVGSGYLCPNLCGPAYLSAAVLAVKAGGLGLLAGMTLVAGAVQALLSRFIHKLRAVLPPEVTGVIVTMVGLALVPWGVRNIAGAEPGMPPDPLSVALGLGCLGLMFGLTVWGRGPLRLYSVLIAVAVAYVGAWLGGLMDPAAVRALAAAPLFGLPRPQLLDGIVPTFDIALLAPFLIAAVSSLVKAVGDLTTCQKINDADWHGPDMGTLRRGVLADALAVVGAGLLGGMPQSTSSSNVGLSLANGVTSRYVGFSAGLIFIGFAFSPLLALCFVYMPSALKGAILVFVACFMIVAGLQLVMSRMMDARKTFVVGVSLIAGLSVDLFPDYYRHLPPGWDAFIGSALSMATVTAIALNLIFRIGIARQAKLELRPGDDGPRRVQAFLERHGGAWGARRDVIQRAMQALTEFVDVARPLPASGTVRVKLSYDELRLDAYLLYGGEPLDLNVAAPSAEELLEDGGALQRLSALLIRRSADAVRQTRRGPFNLLRLSFES